ncbi:MAG TPA: hypothetical protein VMR41_03215 [Patescibacteria group bacterium]|nr:hypothetical protein [Patescibacteria group bacterium]
MNKKLSFRQLAYLSFYVILLLALGKTFASCDIRTGIYPYDHNYPQNAYIGAMQTASGLGAYLIGLTTSGDSYTATFLMKTNDGTGSADCGCLEAQKTLGTFTQSGNQINAASHDMPQNKACGDAAFDSTAKPIVGTECQQLGTVNPLLPPVINGVTISSGVWVHLTLHRTNNDGSPAPDSSFNTVTTNGCSDISMNGIPLRAENAKDSTWNSDGVTFHGCSQGGKLLSGTCSSLGIDTGCGGAASINYTSNNDSIVNPCKFAPGDSTDSTRGQVKKTPDTTKGSQSIVNANGIITAQNATTDAVNAGNGILGEIKSILQSMAQDIAVIPSYLAKLYGFDTTSSTMDTSGNMVPDSVTDTTTGYMHLGDSTSALARFHAKMDSLKSADSADTNIHVDSNVVAHTFDSLRVNWGDTSSGGCPCDSQAFSITWANKPIYINACVGNIGQYLRPLFNIIALIMIFFFYRDTVFRIISQFFTSGWGGRG